MKHILLFLAVTASCFTAGAQSSFSNTGSGLNELPKEEEEEVSVSTNNKIIYTDRNAIDFISMKTEGDKIVFENLPDIQQTKVFITNGSGHEEIQKTISRKNNTIDIARLGKGIYFVTLLNENNNSRKAFNFTRE